MTAPLRVGNASGFYGDRFAAMREMLTDGPLDVLTGDYLAELTMLILGRQRMKDPNGGYARTFLRQLEECLGLAVDRGVKIVSNAGGLNPAGLAEAIGAAADRLGIAVRVAHVTGDDLLPRAEELDLSGALTANAYLGGWGIAECLRAGADIVVTGRVTDASLVVGPAAAHFNWSRTDYDALAGATVAGHVIECGAQATGGNFAFFTEIADLTHPGFPIAEISADGSAVITKHAGTGGAVTVETVTAQLLYEIGAPDYLGPDVTSRFDTIQLADNGPDRVRISGVRGEAPPSTAKVCVNTLAGFRNGATFVLCGPDIEAKAALARRQLETEVGPEGITWTLARTDHPDADTEEAASALLHATIKADDPKRVKGFSRACVELALASYPGFTLTAPPSDGTPVGVYRPAFVPQSEVPHTAVLPDGATIKIAPPDAFTPPRSTDPTAANRVATHPTAAESGATHPTTANPVAAGATGLAAAQPCATGLAAAQHGATYPAPAESIAAGATYPTAANPVAASATYPTAAESVAAGATYRAQLGTVVGARSGDKGGDANLGVWARTDPGFRWLAGELTIDRLRALLPETRDLTIDRYELPNLRAVNFVVHGLLGVGVAASTRFDPQAKALGEWLRSRVVDIPEALR